MKVKLSATLTPGCMVNYRTWYPWRWVENKFGVGHVNWNEPVFVAKLNDQCIYTGLAFDSDTITFSTEFEQGAGIQNLVFGILGLQTIVRGHLPHHRFKDRTVDPPDLWIAQLRIDSVQIENLDVTTALIANSTMQTAGNSAHSAQLLPGSIYLSDNGFQTMPFRTPIYPWLLENFSLIRH